MPQIIDILTLAPADSPAFTADNTLFHTAISGIPPNTFFSNATGNTKMQAGDSFLILTAGIIFPEAFTLWKDPAAGIFDLPQIKLDLKGSSGDIYKIPGLGYLDSFFVPMENYETSLDIFVNIDFVKHLGTPESFRFRFGGLLDTEISTKLAPTVLNGKQFFLSPFIKIAHNLPMAA